MWVRRQSPDIAAGVTTSLEARAGDESAYVLMGAGDQGTVYGYATGETKARLPLPLILAHDICRRLDTACTDGTITGIHSDGKAQVSVPYDEHGHPEGVPAVVVSIQHEASKNLEELERELRTLIVAPAIETELPGVTPGVVLVNPSGRFVTGGPAADAGLTGRKLMVDTYGGLGPHGGGAFSGKDPSKVDRSGAYMARLIAKTIVDAGLAAECEVAISHVIGKADPVAFNVETRGGGTHPDHVLTDAARTVFPLRPAAIIDTLDLRHTRFHPLATYGHFNTSAVAWEWTLPWTTQLREAVTHAHQTTPHQ
ncbi:methionine adenosyltransferase domain-containing protein [Corynebacterium guaraldiae]|uniref:methionine adenosyltransferase domain-containing protein n=1 Tax=Corynebacterium guaraldiae TaxID=3051103 RepID=UPI0020940E47|nr:methionine adenosyltransferase domain-containing protein [Corynebacterium guaraldiae]